MSTPIRARRLRTLPLALTAALACAALGAGSANAASHVSCTGDEAGTFSPNLTNTLQTITYGFTENLSCSSATDPTIRSGTASLSGAAVPLSNCASVTGGLRSRTITWNTGETSTITFLAVGTTGSGNALNISRTGTVTSGKFLTAVTTGSLATTFDFGLCSGTGVPGYEGTTELRIDGLL